MSRLTKLRMRPTLFALRLNELLDRPRIVSFNSAVIFLSVNIQALTILFRGACLTPELTRAEHKHSTFDAGSAMKGMLSRRRVQ